MVLPEKQAHKEEKGAHLEFPLLLVYSSWTQEHSITNLSSTKFALFFFFFS